jgi:hypothetical protein
MRRRDFLGSPGALALAQPVAAPRTQAVELPKLAARWIWYPEGRTLQNTFVLFRREFDLAQPGPAQAWVSGNSRYELLVNGRLVSRGPAPCDPRFWDVDPVELGGFLKAGRNVVCGIVCYFGGGDGTWVPPNPLGSGGGGQGFLFEAPSLGWKSDESWKTLRARSWRLGGYQRWFLRALQEEFDMRLWPEGWLAEGYDDRAWQPAMASRREPGLPNLPETPRAGFAPEWRLQARTIPPIREERLRAPKIAAAGWVDWKVAPEEFFECFPPGSFDESAAAAPAGFPVRVPAPGKRSYALTLDMGREVVGHPYVTLRAKAGTVVEILFCERQEPGKLVLRTNPRFGQWARLVTRDGENPFETFEYDALRMLQLLVRNSDEPVEILDVGVNVRSYAWPHACDLKFSDAHVQRACNASLATHHLVSQETLVDNVTRERQQYAGDLDHAKLASYYAHGEIAQPARMIRTFAQGQSREGWFPDCWPAWDRCQRLWQKHLGLTEWGPIIDHSLQFGIAVAEHYLFSGDRELLREMYPKIALFDSFLRRHLGTDGLLPVEPWTWNSVWIDHIGYAREEDKHAALNIYYAGFLQEGLARLAEWAGDARSGQEARGRAKDLISKARAKYWWPERKLFVDNLPRVAADGETRVHARTLSMALLFGAIAPDEADPALKLLAGMPTKANPNFHELEGGKLRLGANYPLNDIWRLWALGRYGLGAAVVSDLRERWANLPSVLENGTYAEFWNPQPSSTGNVWCQSNPVPLIAAYQVILGLRPTAPGFSEYEVRPQPGDLTLVEATVHSVRGPIGLRLEGRRRGFGLRLRAPAGAAASLVVPDGARVTGMPPGTRFEPARYAGQRRALLPAAREEREWRFEAELR